MYESLYQGQMPEEWKFFYGGKNDDFLTKLKLLGLNGDMQKFGEFLTSDYCARTLRENKLTIHIETDSIYYENFNTNESFLWLYFCTTRRQ